MIINAFTMSRKKAPTRGTTRKAFREHTTRIGPPLDAVGIVLGKAREVAVEYYRLSGRPPGIAGEIGECEAARLLGLHLVLPTPRARIQVTPLDVPRG